MAQKVYAVVSQKGGVGKTSTSYSLAVSFALEGKSVLLADFDSEQKSAVEIYESRATPIENLTVKFFKSVEDMAIFSRPYKIIVADGAPHASATTLALAGVADRIIIPTGTPMVDLRPAARLALELIDSGIERKRVRLALYKTLTPAETLSAHEALSEQDLKVAGSLKSSAAYASALDAGKALQEVSHPSLKDAAALYIERLKA
nr:parA [uncultured bacterium]